MDDESQKKNLSLAIRVKHIMRERCRLHDDKAEDTEIEARIRDGVELRGATPWVLIFVASRVIIFPFVAGHSSWQES